MQPRRCFIDEAWVRSARLLLSGRENAGALSAAGSAREERKRLEGPIPGYENARRVYTRERERGGEGRRGADYSK